MKHRSFDPFSSFYSLSIYLLSLLQALWTGYYWFLEAWTCGTLYGWTFSMILKLLHSSWYLMHNFFQLLLYSLLKNSFDSGMEFWWNVRSMVRFKWIPISQVFLIWLFHLQILQSLMMWGSIPVLDISPGNPIKFFPLCLLMDNLSLWVTGTVSFFFFWFSLLLFSLASGYE